MEVDASPIDASVDTLLPDVPEPLARRIIPLSSPAYDGDPCVTSDLLEMFFVSDRSGGVGGRDIWVSTRATASDPWGAPTILAGVNSTADEGPPEISTSGQLLLFSSTRAGGSGGHDLYYAVRPNRTSPFSGVRRLATQSSAADDFAPFITSDSLAMVFSSRRQGTDDLWLASRTDPAQAFGTPVKIVELATSSREANAWVSDDRLEILFNSDRPGAEQDDIWKATRTSTSMPWGTPTRMADVNGSAIDTGPWRSATTLYFASSRDRGDFDLYEATLP